MKITKLNESRYERDLKIIYPENDQHEFTKLNNCKNSIFLAGPCPREDYSDDWRNEAIYILKQLNFKGTVIVPTNKFYDVSDSAHLEKQTLWEYEAMKKASAIVFWIERSNKHPAFTTNIEFGMWMNKPGVFVGWSDEAIKNEYLDLQLKRIGKIRYKTLYELLNNTINDLNRAPQNWFLSDTHFSQERTLTLSRRPFINVKEMDLELISNWNKIIRNRDNVYFLGDFGADFNYLNLLNFGTLHFVLGNYERFDRDHNPIEKESREKLKSFNNVLVYNRGECKITLSDGNEYTLVHEPIPPEGEKENKDENAFYIYGHIHGRHMYKKNGVDCGIDSNNFCPLSEETILWRKNAVKYLDNNVWMKNCK